MKSKFTPKMDELILSHVSMNPQNITEGCRSAASQISRLYKLSPTTNQVAARYYNLLRKKKRVVAVVSDSGQITQSNYKNVASSKNSKMLDLILPDMTKAERKKLLIKLLAEFVN